MEKPHSPYSHEGPIDFHRERSSNNGNLSSNSLSVIRREDERSKSKSPHVTIPNGNGNHSSSKSSGHYSPNGNNNNNHSSNSSGSGGSSGNGNNGNNSGSNVTNGTSNGTNGSNGSPLTKNIGVGANLNLPGRHSSASVNLGHGHLGSINGPSSVSISIGMNPSGLTTTTSSTINGTSSSGRGLVGTTPGTTQGQHGRLSHSPGLISSTILPELLQAHAAGAVGAQSGPSSSSSLASRALQQIQQSQAQPPPRSPGQISNNNNPAPNPTTITKVGGSSPVKQGILGRQPRGEMSNSSTSTNKIVSQNVNGTLALTGIPTNESELQLFRVLQRANLLTYFDVMIELGGDDVQQLCEAGEEEFLEIMALIGMASKPLHVRRLQKALQEWMSNPSVFQTPVLPPGVPFGPTSSSRRTSDDIVTSTPPAAHLGSQSQLPPVTSASIPTAAHQNQSSLPIRPIPYHSAPSAAAAMAAAAAQQAMFLSPSEMKSLQSKLQVMTNGHGVGGGNGGGVGSNSNSPNGGNGSTSSLSSNGSFVRGSHLSPNRSSSSPLNSTSGVSLTNNHSFSNGYHHHPPRNVERHEREALKEKESHIHTGNTSIRIPADQIIPSHFLEQRIRTSSEPNSPAASESHSEGGGSLSPIPFLQETEIQKLSDVAMHTVKTLPPYVFEPLIPPKRKFSGDFELILRLPLNDPRRIDEIRKASTVYGRPDSYSSTHPNKRKMPKPLTMHEVSVNEAAAQLCKHIPALLTRRDELFAVAKQVVREAGLPYSNNNFSISLVQNNNNNNFANHNLKHKNSHLNNHHHHIELNHEHRESNGGGLNGFSSKRLRLDANGIEIQEYHRPPSAHSEHTSDNDNSMQITPIRSFHRRSPSEDQSLLPLELVTVTTSSPRRSSDSGSPPSFLRRSIESDDLINGFKITGHKSQSIKITSIPVSGGCINITHDPSITGTSGPLTLIKTEPAN